MVLDEAVTKKAVAFAKKNKKVIAKRLTDPLKFFPEENPVSVFMAGSPGAGKTEASKRLLGYEGINGSSIIRIDPDELRAEFEDYNGKNSHLFQYPISILVDKILDNAFKQKQSFLLDGTLAGEFDKLKQNVDRSVKKSRFVQIYYVYQEPLLAWDVVQKREVVEGRKIKRENFITQYFAARVNVKKLKTLFKKDITVDLLMKDYDGSNRFYRINVDDIDSHIPEKYSKDSLEEIIPFD